MPQDIPKCSLKAEFCVEYVFYSRRSEIVAMFPSLRHSRMIVCNSCIDFLIPGLRRRLLFRGRRCRRRGADRPHLLVHVEESGPRRMTYFRSAGRTDDSDICPVFFSL